MNLSTPGHKMLSPAAPQESPTKSFHCSHCPLTFKSKIFLFEHLNNVHGISVGTALRDAGLSGTNKDNNSDSSISAFECQEILKAHEKCDKKLEDQKMKGSPVISENAATTISVIAATAHRKAALSKEISSEVMSTSKTKCIQNTSRDLKTYKRPLQTITKYFKAAPGSNGNPPFKSPDNQVPLDCDTGTLILQESPPISSPNSSGVFKVTAKPMIDLSKMSQVQARILIDDLTPVTPDGQIKQRIPNNAGKRTSKESLPSPLNKKMKIDEEEAKANVQKSEFSFEVSEDEEEKRINLVNGEVESPKLYFCKHCDYNDVDIKRVSTHYENDHPYVRYTSDYIRDPSDQSATFRCLECPIEFLKVVDLKKHYTESHPEAPDVFTIPLGELHLGFKCFVCPSTSQSLKTLRRHYKEMHPTHKVRNSLMYCRYSVDRCQEASYQLNTCEKTPSSERIATENGPLPCEEVKKSPSFQHSTSKGAGVTLFQCNNCDFSHKSVVVMHVHYQKSHPEEEVTIDKIKQLTCVTSQTTSRKTSESPNSVSIVETSTPQKVSDFPKTKNKAKTQETSKTHSESSKTKKLESSDDRTPAKCDGKMSSQMGSLSPTSPNTVFYCQLCSYSSINVRSVVCHHNSKHFTHGQIGIQEILKYTAEFQKKKCQSEAEVSGSTWEQHAYTNAKDLFFCQRCNFGNPTVKGVMGHQAKIHPELKQSNVSVIEHTALIHEEIEKSKSQGKGSSFSSDLPFPLLNEGDECMFFCYLCNYRQRTVYHVTRHFFKIHRGIRAKEDQIRQYTSKVLENKLHLKATSNLEVHQASVGNKGKKLKKTKNLDKSSTVSAFSSKKDPQTQKVFECQRCTFKSQNVRLLKRHIRNFHRSHSSVSNVLNVSSKQGKLQSWYRCELCAFTHTKATTLYNHYQEKHPEHKQSLKFIMTRLYVGPETSFPKKKAAHIKRPDVVSGFDGTNERSPPQRSGQNETKTYRCRACSFKGHSVSSITHHYRAVHPWSVKEDGSVLDLIHVIHVNRKKPSANKQLEDLSELPESFDTYQAPIEFENLTDSADEATASVMMLKCPHCPLLFHTRHGLNTHCGMKHLQDASDQQVKGQTSVHAFKCPHCTYVNSNHHGVITHCQMRHPSLEPGVESLHVDEAYLHDWDGCVKRTSPGGKPRFSGYICKTCPQIQATAEKLYKHCKEDHNQTEPAVSKTEQSEADDTLRSVSKGSLFHKKNYAVVRCRHCDYQCTTKIALGRHILANHKNAPVSRCAYKCVICSKSYFRKKSLGNHYSEKHGKDAFFKYYVPLYENASKKPAPTSPDLPSSQVAENSPEAFQPSTATGLTPKMIFKCPSCPYVNTSSHGTLTHCQMKHPDVMVRTETLEMDEIPLANMAACTLGKGSNERGYMCKICSQIHASSKKLKTHIERHHDQASVHSTEIETENQSLSTDCNSQDTELEADTDSAFDQKSATERADHEIVYRCPQCPYSSLTERFLASHYSQKHGKKVSRKHYANVYQKPFKKPKPPSSVHHYKCDVCSYNGMQRRYLWRHYKVHHRFDSITTCRRLLKYNKVKNNTSKLPESESEDSSQIKCQKCPNLFFDSFEVLSLHYSTLHSSDCKMDFTVIYPPSKSTSGVYRCCHCMKQSNGLKKLCHHIDQHRERYKHQKNTAKEMAERTKGFDAFTRTPEIESTELQDEEPTLESVEEPAQMNITQVETVSSPTSPLSSPSKPADLELLKTLDNEPDSALNHKINKHVVFKPGTLRPFLCRICHYRTTSIPLWRIHFLKNHQGLLMDPAETENHDKENTQAPEDSPSSKPADVHQSDPESREAKHTCKQCARTFKSLRGLRCHQNSHAAVAAIKKLDNLSTSALKRNINKYVVFKPETTKPFLCSICHYRTDVMALWKRHFMKNHRDVLMNPAETHNHDEMNTLLDERRSPNSSEELYNLSEPDEEPEFTEKSMYLEPPDVQRQLNHYSLMAEAGSSSKANMQQSKLPKNSLLHCEFCNFTSEHFSSIRRHLQNRHGRKIHKCKDCNFFSACRKTLGIHIEAGHSTYQSEPTHQKDLRCPFCLYQTKNKNNMIDHIILHREERVVPIEVRRPQLSRYLRGIVFRCHKCTFTSASAENLDLHMAKHDEIKPYKCRLCYFDCTELCDLEAHLCDKHQVVRNHALVGQVSLDQQEARVGRTPEEEEEEEPLSNLEYHNKSEDIEAEEFVTDCDEVQHENVILQTEEASGKDNEEESFTSSSADAPKPEKDGQDTLKRAQNEKFLTDTVKRREPDTERENTADVHFDDNTEPEKDKQMDENQRKPSNRRLLLLQQREEATGAHKLKVKVLQDRMLNLEAGVENDRLRHISVLDEEGSFSRTHKKAVRSVITENIENEVVDKVLNQVILRDEQCSVISAKPKHLPEIKAETPDAAKKNLMLENNIEPQECLTLTPHKIKHNKQMDENVGTSLISYKEEHGQNQTSCEELADPYGAMPVLENEHLKEETFICRKEEEDDRFEDIGEEGTGSFKEHEEGNGIKEADDPLVTKGAVSAVNGAAEVQDSPVIEEKLFPCELCGRNLMNSSELERHVIRHRI